MLYFLQKHIVLLTTMKPTHGDDLVILDWGKVPDRDLLEAEKFACPHCHKFSFFCNGDFRWLAATLWRASVVGFSTKLGRSKEMAGVATLQCGRCTQHFTLPLSHEVVHAYQTDCALWPKLTTATL